MSSSAGGWVARNPSRHVWKKAAGFSFSFTRQPSCIGNKAFNNG